MNRAPDPKELIATIDLARETDFALGALQVRPSLCELRSGNEAVTVEPRVMQALVALAQEKGAVVSRDDLVRRCWGGRVISEDALNRCIAKVRKLAETDSGASFTVETIPRVGYRLLEQGFVEAAPAGAPVIDPVAAEATATNAPTPLAFSRMRLVTWAAGFAVLLIALALVGYRLAGSTRESPAARTIAASVANPPRQSDADTPGRTFRDCADCPDMVAILPSLSFAVGASGDAPNQYPDEAPRHEVWIRHPYAVAKYDVTREEYERFVTDTHRAGDGGCFTLAANGMFVETKDASWRNPGFPQTPHDPAVCISWDDAQAYVAWLHRKSGEPYRLLSESEWEYVARGPPFDVNSGNTLADACKRMNGGEADYHASFPGDPYFNNTCHDGFARTSPVGSFPPNAIGLYDMGGNVWQWTEDCYHDSYAGAPADGSAWVEPGCAMRVVRGGAWTDDPRRIHVTRRGHGGSHGRFSSNGFRVARTM